MIFWIIFALLASSCFAETPWDLEANSLPTDLRLIPAVGNGHVATQVYHHTIYVNNVYNGFGNDSHRARIPSTAAIRVLGEFDEQNFKLDMYTGTFAWEASSEEVYIEQKIFAHREMPTILVNQIEVQRLNSVEGELVIPLALNLGNSSEDCNLETVESSEDTWLTSGNTIETEIEGIEPTSIYQYWTKVPDTIALAEEEDSSVWYFITSIGVDQDEALGGYQLATESKDDLLQSHSQAWEVLWEKGDIVVEGNVSLAQTLHAALFHILISTPDVNIDTNPFAGLSPGGLARGGKINASYPGGPYNDYAGHVFWDMDTWIMPPVMMLHPPLAKTMIQSRLRVFEAVRDNAVSSGYSGVRFPWEQAHTGYETCPWDLAALYQIHITGDVSYSIRQYLYDTADQEFLLENEQELFDMAVEIADFWESRTEWSEVHQAYVINGVMGPDEYASNVNNSVFTNTNAKLALQTPLYILDEFEISHDQDEYEKAQRQANMGSQLIILFDEEKQFHPQYEGFDAESNETIIKQSDVVLLGYPLMLEMSPEVRRNDLVIYEELTDKFGPDTGTWSMHTVGWLELAEYDKANEMFWFMFRNINGPFKIFSEKPADAGDGMRATNFITLAGGMLQAVMFGYGGLRLKETSLELTPWVLPGTDGWALVGLNYRGFTFDLTIREQVMVIEVSEDTDDKQLILTTQSGSRLELVVGEPIGIPRQFATLTVETTTLKSIARKSERSILSKNTVM